MPRFALHVLAVAAGFLLPLPASAQVAVVSARSLDSVLKDSRSVARQLGADEKLEAALKLFLGSKNLAGVDSKRPFGAYVSWPEKLAKLENATFPVIYFVPVADEKRFLGLLEDVSWKPRTSKEGTYRLSVAGVGEHFLCFANGHAYVSTDQAALSGKLPEPASFLPEGGKKSVVTASLRIEQNGKEYEQLFDKGVEAIGRLAETEGMEAQDVFKKLQAQRPMWKAFIKQLGTVSFAVEVDPERNQLIGELALVPRAATSEAPLQGRDFAAACQYLGKSRSRFTPLSRQAPWGVALHFPAFGEEGKKGVEFPAAILKEFEAAVEQKYRSFLKLVPVLFKAIQVDGLDCCVIPKDDSVLVGLKVPNGRQIDHTLRDVLKELPTELKDDYVVEWNQGRQADARIHKVTRFFGDPAEAYLGIREDVIFCGSLKAVKEGLSGFDKAADRQASPLLEVTMSSAGLLQLKDVAEAAKKDLSPTQRDKVQARITVQGGKDLRVRIEGSTWLLKAASKIFAE